MSTRSSGASRSIRQLSSDHSCGRRGHCADRANREVLRNVRHQFLRILARLLLSIAFDRNLPQSALANLFGLLEQSNNVGSSTSTSELDRKLVVRDRMLSQPTHICPFLAMLSSTSRHETPLSSGHGRDVTSGAVCTRCRHWPQSIHCVVHGWSFRPKVFRNVSLEFVKMTLPNIETSRNKCVETSPSNEGLHAIMSTFISFDVVLFSRPMERRQAPLVSVQKPYSYFMSSAASSLQAFPASCSQHAAARE